MASFVEMAGIGQIVAGIGSMLSGIDSLRKGFRQIGDATGIQSISFRNPLSDSDPKATVHKVSNDINDRIKLIVEKIDQGSKSAPVRAFAVRAVSCRVSRCQKCRTVNVLSAVNGGEVVGGKGAVRATVTGDDSWSCGKCGQQGSISQSSWAVPEKMYRQEVEALYRITRQNVRYVRDTLKRDTYQRAERTLDWGGGDCDDYCIVLGSMLHCLGYPIILRIIETKDPNTGRRAGGWTHIFLLVGLPPSNPDAWLPLDASVDAEPGWHPPKKMIARHKDFRL